MKKTLMAAAIAGFLAAYLLLGFNKPDQGMDPNTQEREVVDALLLSLTTNEKITLLTGIGFSLSRPHSVVQPLEGTDNFIPGVAGYTWAMPQHGLPSMLLADGPAGLRFAPPLPGKAPERVATAFPIASLVASTWDQDLASQMGAAMGREARAYGIDIILAPGMNLQRDPLGGRNYEYYSEDPVLSGKMAAAAVRGIQSTGVGATIKHFVANNQETHRTALDTVVDEKTLRELYLRGFEIAVKEGKPAAIMTAYNLLNGEHTSESKRLNTDILREQWGFDGIVMTDWFAGEEPAKQILAGHNLLMPGIDRDRASIQAALDDGSMTVADLDTALRPTLSAILRTASLEIEPFDPKNHAALARQVANEGAVLLANNGALPLADDINLAVFGVGSYDTVSGGTGSGDVSESYTISIAEGLKGAGYSLDQMVAQPLETHIADFKANLKPRASIFDPTPRVSELALPPEVITASAKNNDAAIVTITRVAGEFADRKLAGDFLLTALERKQIADVADAFRASEKPVIIVLNVPGPIEVASWQADADALLVAWLGGQEAGAALADVIKGKANPSGRLAQTWPKIYAAVSTAEHFPGSPVSDTPVEAYAGYAKALPSKVIYEEKGAIGYRSLQGDDSNTVYPFGFGLSYTKFALSNADVVLSGDTLELKGRIANRAAKAGRAVLQAYVLRPGMTTPAELAAFAKTPVLDAGGEETVSMRVALRHLSFFDPESKQWTLPAGDYKVLFGFSSADIALERGFVVAEEQRFKP